MKVAKLEKAVEALVGTDRAEVDAIKKAFVKAKVAAHEKPVSEQIADCKSFMDRAEKRLVNLDESRSTLCWRRGAHGFRVWRPTSQLRFLCHRQSLLQRWKQSWCVCEQSWPTLEHRFPNSPIASEDFVPNTVEEAALWMRCRQQDMEDAIAQGSEGDVSRLAHVIAEGAIQLRQWTQPPSSVVSMVS